MPASIGRIPRLGQSSSAGATLKLAASSPGSSYIPLDGVTRDASLFGAAVRNKALDFAPKALPGTPVVGAQNMGGSKVVNGIIFYWYLQALYYSTNSGASFTSIDLSSQLGTYDDSYADSSGNFSDNLQTLYIVDVEYIGGKYLVFGSTGTYGTGYQGGSAGGSYVDVKDTVVYAASLAGPWTSTGVYSWNIGPCAAPALTNVNGKLFATSNCLSGSNKSGSSRTHCSVWSWNGTGWTSLSATSSQVGKTTSVYGRVYYVAGYYYFTARTGGSSSVDMFYRSSDGASFAAPGGTCCAGIGEDVITLPQGVVMLNGATNRVALSTDGVSVVGSYAANSNTVVFFDGTNYVIYTAVYVTALSANALQVVTTTDFVNFIGPVTIASYNGSGGQVSQSGAVSGRQGGIINGKLLLFTFAPASGYSVILPMIDAVIVPQYALPYPTAKMQYLKFK